jgi:hypothetical protein
LLHSHAKVRYSIAGIAFLENKIHTHAAPMLQASRKTIRKTHKFKMVMKMLQTGSYIE